VQAETHIGGDADVRKQRVILEYHADAPLLRRHCLVRIGDDAAIQPDLARGDVFESGDAAQHRGFAAAAGAEQAADFTGAQRKRDGFEHPPVSVRLLDAAHGKQRGIDRRQIVSSNVHVWQL
jgi:hypothetical protein